MTRYRQAVKLSGLILVVVLLAGGCGDDDSGSASSTTPGPSSSSSTVSSSTSTSSEPTPSRSPTDPDPAEPELSLLADVAAGTIDGHPIGAAADMVIDGLVARLGAAEHDSGWGPTECPPADKARQMIWGDGLRVYFGDDDGARLEGWAFALDGSPEWANLVGLPDGMAWGDHIDEVAAHQGVVAEFSESFGWWEARADAVEPPRSFIADGADELNRVVVGYEPRCY